MNNFLVLFLRAFKLGMYFVDFARLFKLSFSETSQDILNLEIIDLHYEILLWFEIK